MMDVEDHKFGPCDARSQSVVSHSPRGFGRGLTETPPACTAARACSWIQMPACARRACAPGRHSIPARVCVGPRTCVRIYSAALKP